MDTYSYAYLIYGIEFENHILDQIMNDDEYDFFSKTHLRYLRPNENVCKQYTPIFGFIIAQQDECDKPMKVEFPASCPGRFKEAYQVLLDKLTEMETSYVIKEYDFSLGDLIILRTKLTRMQDTIDPVIFLAINKL